MRETTFAEYKELVEKQGQALLDAVQSVTLGDLDVELEIPPEGEGIEVLIDLAIGLEMMIDDIREMLAEQEQARAEAEEARQQLEVALEETQAVQRRYLRQEWEGYAADVQSSRGYLLSEGAEGPSTDVWLPAMTAAVGKVDTVTESDEEEGPTLAVPIHMYGEVIGALGFCREEAEPWSADEIAAVEAIAEQVALAVENQRLFNEMQQASALLGERVNALDCLNDIGRKIDEAPPLSEFLAWVTERIPSATRYPDLCAAAIEFEGQVYGTAEAIELPCQIVQSLRVGGEVAGRAYIAYREERDFLDEDSALLGNIARRVSGYIENQRLLDETQRRAAREQLTREITDKMRRAADMDSLLRTTVQEMATALGSSSAFVQLSTLPDSGEDGGVLNESTTTER